MAQTIETVFLVEMDQYFAVTFGRKPMTLGLQLLPDTLEIIELAIDHGKNRAVFIDQRTGSIIQPNDGKSCLAEHHRIFRFLAESVTCPIRTTMMESGKGPLDDVSGTLPISDPSLANNNLVVLSFRVGETEDFTFGGYGGTDVQGVEVHCTVLLRNATQNTGDILENS